MIANDLGLMIVTLTDGIFVANGAYARAICGRGCIMTDDHVTKLLSDGQSEYKFRSAEKWCLFIYPLQSSTCDGLPTVIVPGCRVMAMVRADKEPDRAEIYNINQE